MLHSLFFRYEGTLGKTSKNGDGRVTAAEAVSFYFALRDDGGDNLDVLAFETAFIELVNSYTFTDPELRALPFASRSFDDVSEEDMKGDQGRDERKGRSTDRRTGGSVKWIYSIGAAQTT